jgi:hypothetical protein
MQNGLGMRSDVDPGIAAPTKIRCLMVLPALLKTDSLGIAIPTNPGIAAPTKTVLRAVSPHPPAISRGRTSRRHRATTDRA